MFVIIFAQNGRCWLLQLAGMIHQVGDGSIKTMRVFASITLLRLVRAIYSGRGDDWAWHMNVVGPLRLTRSQSDEM
jgi:hypothetical protein